MHGCSRFQQQPQSSHGFLVTVDKEMKSGPLFLALLVDIDTSIEQYLDGLEGLVGVLAVLGQRVKRSRVSSLENVDVDACIDE